MKSHGCVLLAVILCLLTTSLRGMANEPTVAQQTAKKMRTEQIKQGLAETAERLGQFEQWKVSVVRQLSEAATDFIARSELWQNWMPATARTTAAPLPPAGESEGPTTDAAAPPR